MNQEKSLLISILAVIALLIVLLLVPSVLFVVDQREMAVVLQFGNPVKERTQPGLYFKAPFIQEVHKFPNTRQFWGDTAADALPDLPTKDDKKIELVPWAVWRVKEPTVFVQRLRTMENAEQRVAQFVRGAIRDVVTQYDLAELVRSTDREMHTTAEVIDGDAAPVDVREGGLPKRRIKMKVAHGRLKILDRIKQEAQSRLAAGSPGDEGSRGIELVDLGISQIEFVPSVRTKTFDRWVAERQAISARNVNEGERMKQEIINEAEAEVQKIEGEGQKQSNELRGNVDAEIIRNYAKAIEQAGEFYTFVRTLEAYKTAISRDTRLILTTDSEFLRLLKRLEPAPAAEGTPAVGRTE